MATVTITNPTTAVENPTPITNDPLNITGNGEVSVQIPAVVNDGNVATNLAWSISNVQNGTFVSTAVDTGSVSYEGASGSVSVLPAQSAQITFFINVPEGEPGVANLDTTADYSVQWV